MPAPRTIHRSMFWRIVRRLLSANRGRLWVMLLALAAGAAITAALLNLQVDAKRRLTIEFRAFGANVVVAARDTGGSRAPTLQEPVIKQVPLPLGNQPVSVVGVLYLIADVHSDHPGPPTKVVLAGETGDNRQLAGGTSSKDSGHPMNCLVGSKVADELRLRKNENLVLASQAKQETCQAVRVRATGGPEDTQIIIPLAAAQKLADLPGRLSLLQIGVPGTPEAINNYIALLAESLPELDVRPIRQFTEGEAKVYNRISSILTATVTLVLVLTGLCVMAATTNVAMERRADVGLMKAIGGATRRVLRLFLTEAAVLGLASGLIGAGVGILLSVWLGKEVFGLAARPRLVVYPVAVALTMLVSVAGAYPLRRLANIRPASVFRGEA